MERVAATSGSAPDAPDHEHAFDASPVSLRKDESTSSGRGSVTQGGSKRSKKLAELLALQYPSRCHALPAGDAAVEKVLYFVRHGEATHNVVRETHVGSDPYLNPALTDAPLTAVGRAQAGGCARRPTGCRWSSSFRRRSRGRWRRRGSPSPRTSRAARRLSPSRAAASKSARTCATSGSRRR